MTDTDPVNALTGVAGVLQIPPPNNIPAQLTTLLGRERDIAAVRSLIQRSDVRLVTLTGPGGVGKTRLSLKVASDLLLHFDGGVYIVNLAPLTDPNLVLQAIAQTVGFQEEGRLPLLTELADRLGIGHTLLVLDNFEQILDAGITLSELLRECPGLKILVTSRSPLKVTGEHEYAVQPLDIPGSEFRAAAPQLGQYVGLESVSSVALFVKRAKAISHTFVLDNNNAAAISEICARLDGLPLAIELAAAHIKSLSPQALLTRLDKRLPILVGGPRDLPARQRTLRTTMEWSYGLLDDEARRTFRYLGVFVGVCSLDAIEQIAPSGSASFAQIEALLDASLLRRVGEGAEPRYTMLETVREYATDKLESEGEADGARCAHALYFLNLAETAESKLSGAEQAQWLEHLEADHDNLRAALGWMLEADPASNAAMRDAAGALRLVGGMWRFWYMRGYLSEGRRWLARVPFGDASLPIAARAMAINGAGVLAYAQGELETARKHFESSLVLRREIGDLSTIAASLNNLGAVAVSQADFDYAVSLHSEALEIRRQIGDKWGMSSSLSNLGSLYINTGDYDKALIYQEQALELRRELGDNWSVAISLTNLGGLEVYRGNLDRAISYHEEALKLRQELGDKPGIAVSLNNLGRALLEQGNVARAKSFLESSAVLRVALSDDLGIVDTLEGLAGVAIKEDQPRRGARLLGAVESLREATGTPRTPADLSSYTRDLNSLHTSLGERVFEAAWVEGKAMSPEQALSAGDAEPIYVPEVAQADAGTLSLTGRSSESEVHQTLGHVPYPAGLTEREVEVLRSVSFGLTSNQVAEKLFISPLTVNVHLRSIYSKLGVNSRTAAVRFAVENKLF